MNKIKDIKRLLTEKEASCTEITKQFLEASQRENADLKAYISLTEETALQTAEQVDEKLKEGTALSPLEGIPFVLKDNIATAGLATTCGSRMLENHVPVYNAPVWESLKQQNAVLIGKGNMDEFAMGSTCETSYFGGAKNPHNIDYVAGGSSGGVASAVAGGLSVFGIGSDTGGSIRQPASFCGIVGLKPTYGAVSRRGLIAYASSFDQIGPLTTCTEDVALVFDAICAKDNLDMTSVGSAPISQQINGEIKDMKIGIAKEYFKDLPADIEKSLEQAMKVYQDLGAELVPVSFPMLKYSLPTYYILACAEASSNLGRYDGIRYGYRTEEFSDLEDFICKTRSEGFGEEVQRRILLGTYVLSAGYFDAYYHKAQLVRNRIKKEFKDIFEVCDCLLTPTVPLTALKSGANLTPVETYQTDICTVTVNIAGLPAVSVPCGFDSKGLPIGMQLIGSGFSEAKILNTAFAFEKETAEQYLKMSDKGVKL